MDCLDFPQSSDIPVCSEEVKTNENLMQTPVDAADPSLTNNLTSLEFLPVLLLKSKYSKTPIYRASWGKELGPVNREAQYIGVHFTLIYTQSLFSGIELRPGKSRDPVNRGTVNRGFTVRS